jgi:hypothetical protein
MATTPVGQANNNVSGVTDSAITQDNGAPTENYDNGHNCYAYGSRRESESTYGQGNEGCYDQFNGGCTSATCFSEACVSDTAGGEAKCPSHAPVCGALGNNTCGAHTGEPYACSQETGPGPCVNESQCREYTYSGGGGCSNDQYVPGEPGVPFRPND